MDTNSDVDDKNILCHFVTTTWLSQKDKPTQIQDLTQTVSKEESLDILTNRKSKRKKLKAF